MDTQDQGLEVIDSCLECRDQQIGAVEGLEAIEPFLESRDIAMPKWEHKWELGLGDLSKGT
jgi:hypothetical protein